MVSVRVSETARFNGTDTPAGRITKKRPATVSVLWSLPRLNDRNLEFTFEESDRETLNSLSEKRLRLAAKTTGTDLTTHAELETLLLPAKKKTILNKPKSKRKPTKKVEEVVEEVAEEPETPPSEE